MKTVWVVSVNTESGDVYDPIVFDKKPSDKQLFKFFRERNPEEFEGGDEGPGEWGSYLHVGIEECEVRKL